MLATMVLAACSSDDTTEPVVKRGMVLKANVEDTDTRATITDNEGKWKFAFATKDVVKYGAQNEAYMSRSAEKWVRGLCFNELGVSG